MARGLGRSILDIRILDSRPNHNVAKFSISLARRLFERGDRPQILAKNMILCRIFGQHFDFSLRKWTKKFEVRRLNQFHRTIPHVPYRLVTTKIFCTASKKRRLWYICRGKQKTCRRKLRRFFRRGEIYVQNLPH